MYTGTDPVCYQNNTDEGDQIHPIIYLTSVALQLQRVTDLQGNSQIPTEDDDISRQVMRDR